MLLGHRRARETERHYHAWQPSTHSSVQPIRRGNPCRRQFWKLKITPWQLPSWLDNPFSLLSLPYWTVVTPLPLLLPRSHGNSPPISPTLSPLPSGVKTYICCVNLYRLAFWDPPLFFSEFGTSNCFTIGQIVTCVVTENFILVKKEGCWDKRSWQWKCINSESIGSVLKGITAELIPGSAREQDMWEM